MKTYKKSEAAILRQKAEELVHKKTLKKGPQLSDFDPMKIVHELEVFQIELELQNEELFLAKSRAAKLAAEKYSELYDFAPSGYFTLSKEGEIIGLNLCGSQMLGKERARLINSRFGFFVSNDTKPIFNLFLGKVFISESKETCELILSVNGNLPMYVHLTGIVTENGTQCMVTVVDITELKLVENALKESEERYRTLIENMGEGVGFLDVNETFVFANPSAEKIFGVGKGELVGLCLNDFLFGENIEIVKKETQKRSQGKSSVYEYEIVLKDGNKKGILVTATPRFEDKKFVGAFAIFRDFTEHKEAEDKLRKSEEKYSSLYTMFRLLADNTDDFLWAKDINNKYTFANKTICDRLLIANNVGEPIGKTDIFFAQRERETHPENPEWHTFDEICANTDTITLNEGKPKQFDEYGNVRGKFLFLDVHKAPIWDEHGNIMGVVGTARDVTHQRQLEDEKLVALESLRKSEENLRLINAEKDKFFSIIAHDLRTPFNGFLGLTEIMAEGLSRMTLDEIRRIALVLKSSATNLFQLLENLLEWSRMQRGLTTSDPESFLLMPKISESIILVLDAANKKEIAINYDIPEDLMVFADGNMFGVIIRNLVTNAVKFTHKGGSVTISAKPNSDNSVEISIKDTGIGMNKNMIANLFRPDINTSRKGTDYESSTGLGLIICKDFIEKHGGQLCIESKEGKGSTFRFELPTKNELGIRKKSWR